MTDPKELFYDYPAHTRAFLRRAQTALAAFDSQDRPEELFRAAMELRFGIEARLFDYIDGSLKSLGQEPKRIAEYSATRLLAKLTALDARAEHASVVRLTSEQTGSSSAFQFTPVTRSLAVIHGKLGGLLHFTYFRNNEHWYFRERLAGPGMTTLASVRDLVQQGIDELSAAVAGTLLAHPHFTRLVAEVNESSAPLEDPGDGAA